MSPGALFKYATPERLDVLERGRIRYTRPRDFNDPFESQPFLSAIAETSEIEAQVLADFPGILQEEIAKLPPEAQQLLGTPLAQAALTGQEPSVLEAILDFQPQLMKGLRPAFVTGINRLALLCLTETPESLLMWAHYGAEHRGICIGFDATNDHFCQRRSDSDSLRHLRRVEYLPERPKVAVADLAEAELYLSKGQEWAYEREWRIAKDAEDADEVLDSAVGEIHLFSLPPKAITTLILGARSSEETQHKAVDLIKSAEWSHVELHRACLHESEYKLVIERI